MIGQGIPAYIGIRLAITLLRLVAPASIVWVAVSLIRRSFVISPWISIFAIPESCFYLFVYLPRRQMVQKTAPYLPARLSREERQELFENCIQNAANLPRWMLTTDTALVGRDNVVDWLLWAFFNTKSEDLEKEELIEWRQELDAYVLRLEDIVGHKFLPGRNTDINPMRLTIDPVVMLHRPLIWYIIVAGVELITASMLVCTGFKHYAPKRWFPNFPPRPWTISSRRSATPHLPYWFRPHRSTTKKPIIFLHGIGIGLFPYTMFIRELDPEVGILIVEILHISTRITRQPILPRPAMLDAFYDTTSALGIKEAVLVSHSFGTVVAGHILRSQQAAEPATLPTRITSYCFIDPIPFLLHFPDVTYNFLYRQPKCANEWLLWYFASQDGEIGRTLRRHFFWTENILFNHHLENEKVAVVLSGKDQIVPSGEVWQYLTGKKVGQPNEVMRKGEERWVSDNLGMEVLLYPEADHATIFNHRRSRKGVAEVIARMCRQY